MTDARTDRLRLGSHGLAVERLQQLLDRCGAEVKLDGRFGPSTDRAVRDFQRRSRLHPDGVVGSATWAAIANQAFAQPSLVLRVESFWGPAGEWSQTISDASQPLPMAPPDDADGVDDVSEAGLDFIYAHEAWAGHSNRLHWPGGSSGVTLGPGYDMKERTAKEIVSTLTGIGVDATTAAAVSAAAGLTGAKAQAFAFKEKHTILLTQKQERALLVSIVPRYVDIVNRMISVPLTQTQFDALVSFAYNPGGRMKRVAHLINTGKIGSAMAEIKKAVTSGGVTMPGLVKRRDHEVDLFLNGHYAKSATE